MAGKNQPRSKARVVVYTSRAKARQAQKLRSKKREAETKRVMVPRY